MSSMAACSSQASAITGKGSKECTLPCTGCCCMTTPPLVTNLTGVQLHAGAHERCDSVNRRTSARSFVGTLFEGFCLTSAL